MLITERMRAEQIKSIYRNASAGMVGTLLASAALTGLLVYIGVAEMRHAVWFVVLMVIQTFVRMDMYRRYAKKQRPIGEWRRWAAFFTIGAVIGGISIGGGVIWMVLPASTELQLTALLLVFAVASGAVSAYGAYLPTFYAFFISMSLAPFAWLLSKGGTVHTTLAALYALWFIAVSEQARRSNQAFAESVRLRFENSDLVESLRVEKAVAEQANTAKSRFLAAASHDLRQPVHALSLFVEAMRSRKMDDEARNLLGHIDGSVQAMGGLFGGLLDISRLDAGVVEVNRSSFSIQPLLERVCRDYESQARDKGIHLRLHRCSLWVYSDAMLLERIVRNIIANAVTYTHGGKIIVGCRRGKQLAIQVWDTGRGISEADQALVFQEFYQLDNPERDRNKGVGLGLAIVKRLALLLGHPLRLVSQLNKGSMFSVEVPTATPQTVIHLPIGDTDAIAGTNRGGLILVVDDEVTIQSAMQSLLQSWGYHVVTAATCDEMLARIADLHEIPNLIICDYRLRGDENGIAIIERLRSEYNDDIPGMLITGDTAPDRLKEAQDSGFLLLHKPVPNAKLRAAIAHLVNS